MQQCTSCVHGRDGLTVSAPLPEACAACVRTLPPITTKAAAVDAMRADCGGYLAGPDKFRHHDAAGKAAGRPFATAWGLPARHACPVGNILADIAGTPCAGCYGDGRGRYGCSNVVDAQSARLEALDRVCDDVDAYGLETPSAERWLRAFCAGIAIAGVLFHRWHDTGDTHREAYRRMIIAVAERLPDVAFWLPTQDHEAWRALRDAGAVPTNLVVRFSARALNYFTGADATALDALEVELAGAGVDMTAPAAGESWSCVDTTGARHVPGAVVCGCAGRHECGSCRACWNARVPVVIYPIHTAPRSK